jgi:hypothetical protein
MTSRSGALVAPPSWGRVPLAGRHDAGPRRPRSASRPRVRWGIRAPAASDVATGAAILAGTLGLWAAFLAAAW